MPRKISTDLAISHTVTSMPSVSSPSQPGQQLEVEVAEQRVGDDLEQRVDRDEHRRQLSVAAARGRSR